MLSTKIDTQVLILSMSVVDSTNFSSGVEMMLRFQFLPIYHWSRSDHPKYASLHKHFGINNDFEKENELSKFCLCDAVELFSKLLQSACKVLKKKS